MRKTFILATIAVTALAGGATGVANASDAEPSATPTTVPFMPDLESVMSVLTPEQLVCIAQSMGGVDTADPAAAMAALTECGVSMEQLMQIATGETPATTVVGGTTTPPVGAPPDEATITAVLGLLGIDATDLACLSGALAVPPADDTAALAILTGCQISLTELLQSIVTVGSGGNAVSVPSVPSVTTVVGTAAATGNPIADLLIEQFTSMGMTLTSEQATCLADQITSGTIDPATIGQDMTALTNLLTTCGIELTDLMGG
jgi:hypothetical protein